MTNPDTNSPSVTVSSAAGEIVFGAVFMEDATAMQIQSPGVEDWEILVNDAGAGAHSAGAPSVTLDWTSAPASDKFAAVGVAIRPATTTTFAIAQDTALSGLATLTPMRLRFEVSNEGTASSGSVSYQLQVAETATCSSGSYAAVPTGSTGHWQIVDSVYITDGEATSNIVPGLFDESTTFVVGQLRDANNATNSITLASDEFTEIEYAIQATGNSTPGGNYCFRLYDNTTASVLDTYDIYAQASVAP